MFRTPAADENDMPAAWSCFCDAGSISPDGKAREWPLYDLKDKYVMTFDEFDIHAEKESALNIVDWDRTYFLTKYYVR